MRGRRHRQRVALLAVVGLLSAGLGVLAHMTHAARRVELSTVDARFSIRGERRPPRDVVLVGLDATSLAAFNQRPPISRTLHARLLDVLRRDHAKVIAYDFAFLQQTTAAADNRLFEAVRAAGNVILATDQVNPGGRTDVLGGAEGRHAARTSAASTNFPPRTARGGVLRRIPYAELGLPAFAVAVAGRALGHAPSRHRFAGDGAWIDFAGGAGTVTTLSFSDVVAGRIAPARLRGKVVVVGATDPAIGDILPTAAGEGMPGSEVQANAIETILRGFPLRDAPGWLSILLIAAVGLVVPAGALRLRGLRWLPIPVVVVLAYPIAAQLAFDGGTILPLAAPALALLLGVLGTLAVANWTDLRERRRLQSVFGRFVPPQVVDDVIAQAGDELSPMATRREGTVLFCEIGRAHV